MTPDKNIERLSRDIIQQAESDAEHVLAEAKTKAEQIQKLAQEEAAVERKKILDQAKRDADRIRGQVIATTQLKARTLQLDSREKLLNEVFSTSFKKLTSVLQHSDYEAIVERLATEAIEQLGAEKCVIHADKVTHKLLTESVLKKLNTKFKDRIELGKVLEKGTGLIVTTANGHLTFDNTLETRLQRLENELRAPVNHLLMEEGL